MKRPRGILIAGAGAELRALLAHVSDAIPDVEVFEADTVEPQRLNGKAVASAALLVEVDLTSPTALPGFEKLTAAMGERKVIAAARNAQPADVRRLFRAGAVDVLTAPFTPLALETALSEVLDNHQVQPLRAGQVVSVLKAAGGVGATTTALNLAALCARGDAKQKRPGRRTGLIDLDLQFGDIDIALNLEPRSNLLDVIRGQSRFDSRFLEGAMVEHASGLKLLASPPKVVPLDALSADFAADIVRQSSRLHERTFIDLPSVWTDWTISVLKGSDLVLLLASPTVQGALGAKRALEALTEAGVATPVMVVLNGLGGLVDSLDKPSRIARSLERPIDATLSHDANATRAADRGAPLVEAFPNARLTRELRSLATAIDAKLAPASSRKPEHLGAAA